MPPSFFFILTHMYSKVNNFYHICVHYEYICIVFLPENVIHYHQGVMIVFELMLDSKIVGEAIAEIRKKKGISQDVLSGLAGIGRTHLSAIERGERKPTLETLYRLSIAFDMKMSEIFAQIEERL